MQKPEVGLRSIAELRRRLDELEEMHVEDALRRGWSWSRIAAALGVSKQAAHKKHSGRLRGGREAGRQKLLVTAQARRTVQFARREARALGHTALGTEHLLLGLLQDESGVACRALTDLGLTLDHARGAVEELLGRQKDSAADAEVPVSPRAHQVFEQSLREAVSLGSEQLGGEHLLLALLREQKGGGVRALAGMGVEPGAVEGRVLDILGVRLPAA